MRESHIIPHPSLSLVAHRCGPEDLEPMLDRLETLLHEDYFFRRKHFAAILARPQAAVYAILVSGEFCAIIILYNGSTLTNLYVHPEHRAQGVGQAVLSYFTPEVVRAKGNMSQGDPVPFYEKAGYKAVGADPQKPHIVIMEKKPEPTGAPAFKFSPHPVPVPGGQDKPKKEVSDEKRAHLARIREKSIARRKQLKQLADMERLIKAGIDPDKARELAGVPAPAPAPASTPALPPSAAKPVESSAEPVAGAPAPAPASSTGHWPWSE
jgi:GNAT superfamily N-acetyltransferase